MRHLVLKFSILIISICFTTSTKPFLNDDEQSILVDLVGHLQKKKIIFVSQESQPEISCFKKFSMLKLYVSFKSLENIFLTLGDTWNFYDQMQTVLAQNAPYEWNLSEKSRTIFILKSRSNIHNIRIIFSFFHHRRATIALTPFVWLFFIDKSTFLRLNEFMFFIPYDCEFLIVYPEDSQTYKIIKLYYIGENRIVNDYGTWSYDDYNFSKLPKYPNHVDMNGTKTVCAVFTCTELIEKQYAFLRQVDQSCLRESFFRDIVNSLKFKYIETEENYATLGGKDKYRKKFDALNVADIYFHGNDLNAISKFIKYWPKYKLALLIKKPESKKVSDFYVRPFNYNVWVSLILMVMFGSLICITMGRVKDVTINNNRNYNFINLFLLPYELLIGRGDEYDTSLSFRILSMVLRVSGIFIALSYSSDIIAHLSVQTSKLPFESLEELVENKKYKLLMAQQSITSLYFKYYRKDEVGETIMSRLVEYYTTFEEYDEKICSDKNFAFAFYQLFHPVGTDRCKYALIPRPIAHVFAGTWLNPDNHYSDLMNHIHLKAWESGLTQRIIKSQNQKDNDEEEDNFETIEMSQLIHLFWFLGIMLFMSFIFLICELFLFWMDKSVERGHRSNAVVALMMKIPALLIPRGNLDGDVGKWNLHYYGTGSKCYD